MSTTSDGYSTYPRSTKSSVSEIDDLELHQRMLHSPPPNGDGNGGVRRHQSPRFHRIQVLVDEEVARSPTSPLSPRRTPTPSKLSREASPPSYREVMTNSPILVAAELDSEFSWPAETAEKIIVTKTTERTIINAAATSNHLENGIDFNSNFPDRMTSSSFPVTSSSSSSSFPVTSSPFPSRREITSGSLERRDFPGRMEITSPTMPGECPGGDHDHQLCRRHLDDIHAQLLNINMGFEVNGTMETVEREISSTQYSDNYSPSDKPPELLPRAGRSQANHDHSSVRRDQKTSVTRTGALESRMVNITNRHYIDGQIQQDSNINDNEIPLNARTPTRPMKQSRDNGSSGDKKPFADGSCTCCPYGFHIDVTFLNYFDEMNSDSTLDKLIQIRRKKKQLRKSMEIYLQEQENGTPDTDAGESLMTMMEEDEKATQEMLNEIDRNVDATLTDTMPKSHSKSSLPEFDESLSVSSSGPMNASSPKPNGYLKRRGSNDSQSSSLDTSIASERNATVSRPNYTGSANEPGVNHINHQTRQSTTHITSTSITSHQLAVNMASCFDDIRSENHSEPDTVNVTPEQLRKMREQIALSLQRMKELEEQVKAIPVLQVRMSVLKEEKRLWQLQSEAKNKRMSKVYRTIGVGDQTIDEPERPRSRSQSPSFDMSDFASFRRTTRRTPLPDNASPTSSKPSTQDSGVGDGDVKHLYYLQPLLVTQEEFIDSAKALLPEHIKAASNEPDAESLESGGLFGRRFAEENSPWSLPPDERRSSSNDELTDEFRRMEESIDRIEAEQPVERFFAKPDMNIESKKPDTTDSGGTTTFTTTRTTKLFEEEDRPTSRRGAPEVIRVPEYHTQLARTPPKPRMRDFGQNYNAPEAPKPKPCLLDKQSGEDREIVPADDTADRDEFGRKIITTTTVTRSNLLLQEQRVKLAIRDALHRDVKSVGINVKFATTDRSTITDSVRTRDQASSDDTTEVNVRPNVWLRSVGTEVKPSVVSHATWTDKLLIQDSFTNTPTIEMRTKTTCTTKVLSFPAACNTEPPSTYSIGVGTDLRTFFAMNVLTNSGVNTEGLCTCGPEREETETFFSESSEDYELPGDVIVPVRSSRAYASPHAGTDDDSSKHTSTSVLRRIVSYETNPITISVNRESLGALSAHTSPTMPTHPSLKYSTGSDSELDHEIRLKDRDESTRFSTYDRHFITSGTKRSGVRYHSPVTSRIKTPGIVGDSLMVKRVKSYGYNPSAFHRENKSMEYSTTIPGYSVGYSVGYKDQTDAGSYMSTVSSTNETFGPNVSTTGHKTFIPQSGYVPGDFPQHVTIERSETSATSADQTAPFIDSIDVNRVGSSQASGNSASGLNIRSSQSSSVISSSERTIKSDVISPVKSEFEESQSDIFGRDLLDSTIVRSKRAEGGTRRTRNRRSKVLDEQRMLSGSPVEDRTQGSSSLSSGSTSLISSSGSTSSSLSSGSTSSSLSSGSTGLSLSGGSASLSLSSGSNDIPLTRKQASTNLTSATNMTSSSSQKSTSKTSSSMTSSGGSGDGGGGGGGVVENIRIKSEYSASGDGQLNKDFDINQQLDKMAAQLEATGVKTSFSSSSMKTSGSSGGLIQSSLISGNSRLSNLMSGKIGSKNSSIQEYSSSKEIHSQGGMTTVKEESTKKLDGEVVDHSSNVATIPGDSRTFIQRSPLLRSKLEHVSDDKDSMDLDILPNSGSMDLLNTGLFADRKDDGSYVKSKELRFSSSSVTTGGQTSVHEERTKKIDGEVVDSQSYSGKIPSLSSDKTLADFKQESSKLKSRLLRTEAVLGDFSASANSGSSNSSSRSSSVSHSSSAHSGKGSLMFANKNADVHTEQVSMQSESSTSSDGTTKSRSSKERKVDGRTVEKTETSSDGTTSSVPKSIMKKSSGKKTHVKKEIKFAAGTVGGYVSRSSDSESSDSDTSNTSSGSEDSFDEGSYDGRQGKITYTCQDNMSQAHLQSPDPGSTTTTTAPASVSVDLETAVIPVSDSPRESFALSADVRQACELLSDDLTGKKRLPADKSEGATRQLQEAWFAAAGQRLTNPHQVEKYIKSIRRFSTVLLEKVVNLSDSSGNTCLHYSVFHCNFETLSILLDTGVCDVNKANRAGYTPIMMAAVAQVQMDRQKDVLRYLFRQGNVNMRASQAGQTALMLSVSNGRKEMVKLLLDCGADINAQDEDGSTALMCACEHGHVDICKILLAQPECDATLVDNDGSSALSIAMETDHKDIAVLLYAKLGMKKSGSPIS